MVDRSVVQSGRYKAYPEYKDSGVEWLDVIPSSWSYSSLRWISEIYAGGTPSKAILTYWENGTVPWINSGSVNQGLITKPSEHITEEAVSNSSTKWVPNGSLVVALAGQGKTKGMVAQTGIDTTCNQSMAAIVMSDIERTRYIYWWLTSNYQNIRNMAGGDLRDGLNLEHLGNIKCPMPDIKEAKKIASFLDYETAKIDTLIEKQQRLIELLTEKRQAVISYAVTKGLNPDVPMKDSGVEWLGEVPEHWEVTKIGWVLEYLSYGFTNPMPTSDEGPYMLTATDISFNEILFDQARTTTTNAYENFITDKSRPKLGDLLLTKDGTLGRVAVFNSTNKTCISQSIALLRPNKKYVLPYFMAAALASSRYQEKMIFDAGGTTIKHIYISVLSKMNLALPDINEQQEIVSYIDSECLKLDDLISKAEQAIQLMQERRTALISAAVTGKIDVRDWVTPVVSEVYS